MVPSEANPESTDGNDLISTRRASRRGLVLMVAVSRFDCCWGIAVEHVAICDFENCLTC